MQIPQESTAASGRDTGAAWTLRLIGAFCLTGPNGEVAISARKNRGLLAILALAPGRSVSREQVCNLLWSDRSDEQARSSLRQSLAVLRKELGPPGAEVLQTPGDRLSLQPMATDVTAVHEAARTDNAELLRRAAAQLTGPLLPDLSIRDAAFEDWLTAARRGLEDAAVTVLERLTRQTTGAERIGYARRLVQTDPLREAAHHLLIESYQATGEAGLAQRQREEMRRIFRDELGIEPAAPPSATPPIPPAVALPASAADTARPVVAVQPLAAGDGDAMLAHGFSVDLAHALRRFGEIVVLFADRNLSPALVPSCELRGAFRRSGDRLRISIHLSRPATGELLWSEVFDRGTDDLFAMQDEVIEACVYRIVRNTNRQALISRHRSAIHDVGAHELFLQGRENVYLLTPESLAEAEQLLSRALQLDPHHATALAWLAEVNFLRWWAGWAGTGDGALRECLRLARRAVDLDPADGFAWAELGQAQTFLRDYDGARVALDRALGQNAHDPDIITIHAFHLLFAGDAAAADAAIRGAMRRDPTGHYGLVHGMILLRLGHWRDAETSLSQVRNRVPDTHLWTAAACAMQGNLSASRAALAAYGRAARVTGSLDAAAGQALARNAFRYRSDADAIRQAVLAALGTGPGG